MVQHGMEIKTFNTMSKFVTEPMLGDALSVYIHYYFKENGVSTYIVAIFANKSAYYVGLVLASTSQGDENFYFQFQFTDILPLVCFIAFFSKFAIDTVLSL